MSDLTTGFLDPLDVVLIVFGARLCDCTPHLILMLFASDEAHKATGDSAYNQVMRFMMAKNPNFRVLALTATPASKPEDVQKIIDGLHISHIEIRSESSIDTQPYVHQKVE